jgi:putative colanic acid biosynthesis UDP-glucose lipid carrier transferase
VDRDTVGAGELQLERPFAEKYSSIATHPPKLVKNVTSLAASDGLKRLLDVSVAIIILFLLLPVLLILAAWIMIDSPGPVLFRQRRTGLGGAPFTILKFRTMYVVEDGPCIRQASRGDDRITRIGAILRRTSIDEFPQLLNIIAGDMSLVGPRPHALAHDLLYGEMIPDYRLRFRCRPGLTGLAQVSGFRGEIHSISNMHSRIAVDNFYIDNWSIFLDFRIMFATIPRIFADPQAY